MTLYTGRLLVRDIVIELKLEPAPKIVCLEGEIRQVVNNLVRNALDAMEGGGSLFVRLHTQPEWRTGRKGVRLTVADTGEGIGLGILPHLFEPFHTTKELNGTGLGLWVSKGIVEKHGGHIFVKTRRGQRRHGTVFAIWLPVEHSVNLSPRAD
jgi:signal transduction histidine kinase